MTAPASAFAAAAVAVVAPWLPRIRQEGDLQHVQVALADVADRHGALGASTEIDRAEVACARDSELAARREARDRERPRPIGIVARDSEGSRLGSEAGRLEADLDVDGVLGGDDQWVRVDARRDELVRA